MKLILALVTCLVASACQGRVAKLEDLRARLCECPTTACATQVRADIDAWNREYADEPTSRRIEALRRELLSCDQRFSM